MTLRQFCKHCGTGLGQYRRVGEIPAPCCANERVRLNVLLGAEMSSRVRDEFLKLGHFAVSCDLLDTIAPDPDQLHYKGDVFDLIREPWRMLPGGKGYCGEWDMLIAFPPCTHLAGSGARWLTDHWVTKKSLPTGRYWHNGAKKRAAMSEAYEFFMALWNARQTTGKLIPRCALENPVGRMSTLWRKPDQIIQPWQFGHNEIKATCLWLRGLPLLKPTRIVAGREQRIWKMAPGPQRSIERSLTYTGIARAMASQWGTL